MSAKLDELQAAFDQWITATNEYSAHIPQGYLPPGALEKLDAAVLREKERYDVLVKELSAQPGEDGEVARRLIAIHAGTKM